MKIYKKKRKMKNLFYEKMYKYIKLLDSKSYEWFCSDREIGKFYT